MASPCKAPGIAAAGLLGCRLVRELPDGVMLILDGHTGNVIVGNMGSSTLFDKMHREKGWDGVGYDFIAMRRIWSKVTLQARYYLYDIKNYLANNGSMSRFSGKNAPVGFEYKDYVVNLERVCRHGIEVNLGGETIKGLSFYTSYTYQELRYKGRSPLNRITAKIVLGGQAKHLFKAGIRYLLSHTGTCFMADYGYRSEELFNNPTEVAADAYLFYITKIRPHHLLDVAIEQTILKDKYYFKNLRIKFFL